MKYLAHLITRIFLLCSGVWLIAASGRVHSLPAACWFLGLGAALLALYVAIGTSEHLRTFRPGEAIGRKSVYLIRGPVSKFSGPSSKFIPKP